MENISIDSLKVRIPIEKVEVLDESIFGDKIVVDANSGMIESEFKQKRHVHSYDGITTSFGVETQITANQKTKDYLVILFNSKLLHEKYFDGIDSENIETIFYRIMSLKKVKIDYDVFLSGECTDVDYKWDMLNDDFDRAIKTLHQFAKTSKNIGIGCNAFTQQKNKGIEFGKRNTATPNRPFLKFYHKGLELLNKSSRFYSKYIVEDVTNKVRGELTIKNKKGFRRYDVSDTTLKAIVRLSQDTLQMIAKDVIRIHLEPRMTPVKTPSDMTPSDIALYNCISIIMSQGLSYNTTRESMVQNMKTVAKSRFRARLDSIYENAIKGSDLDSTTQKQDKFFASMGWT